jgi:hypothetical protein
MSNSSAVTGPHMQEMDRGACLRAFGSSVNANGFGCRPPARCPARPACGVATRYAAITTPH